MKNTIRISAFALTMSLLGSIFGTTCAAADDTADALAAIAAWNAKKSEVRQMISDIESYQQELAGLGGINGYNRARNEQLAAALARLPALQAELAAALLAAQEASRQAAPIRVPSTRSTPATTTTTYVPVSPPTIRIRLPAPDVDLGQRLRMPHTHVRTGKSHVHQPVRIHNPRVAAPRTHVRQMRSIARAPAMRFASRGGFRRR
jgi:hypothetical protein